MHNSYAFGRNAAGFSLQRITLNVQRPDKIEAFFFKMFQGCLLA